jgi:hypothetical protein
VVSPLFFVSKKSFTIALLYLILSILFLFNTDNFYVKIFAHQFTPNETATFIAVINELQAELGLVPTNLENNNVTLSQNHASKAAAILTPRILTEIAEDNPRLAADLANTLTNLQNLSTASDSQKKSMSQLILDLNDRLAQAAVVRISQLQPDNSNILDQFSKFFGTMLGQGDKEVNSPDTKIEALALANVIDSVLVNYGNAYNVGFDMTNMSNMVMQDPTKSMSHTMNMNSMNGSHPTSDMNDMEGHHLLVNVSDYQSARALAAKSFEIFKSKLEHATTDPSGNVTVFITNLGNGLADLNSSIGKKASPMDIMMMVHTKVHPNLLQAFNLELRK